jgi:type IV pilus assembly protein PilO
MNLSELDFEDVGSWPPGVKAIAALLLIGLICLGGWWFLIRDMQDELESAQRQEGRLFTEFEDKVDKAANLQAYRDQLEEMRVMFNNMLRQLPSKAEMPELLVDVSQTALGSGIRNELFKPGAEVVHEFYAEQPIEMRMVGHYHEFGQFVSGVASLPRIVILTMNDIAIEPENGEELRPGGELVLKGTAKTYRYVADDEFEQESEGGPQT